MVEVTHVFARRAWTVVGWVGIAAVVWASLAPSVPRLVMHGGDSMQHAIAFAALAWWFAQVDAAFRARSRMALLLLALGVGIEFAQRLTPWRTFSVPDMAWDGVGILLGWMAALLLPNGLDELDRWLRRRPVTS